MTRIMAALALAMALGACSGASPGERNSTVASLPSDCRTIDSRPECFSSQHQPAYGDPLR
jgi:hypothetical protein